MKNTKKMKKLLKTLMIILVSLKIGYSQKTATNANPVRLSYTLNTPFQLGKTIDVRARVVKLKSDATGNYVYLVKGNTTYIVKVADKALFALIKDNEFLILKNCTYVNKRASKTGSY